MLTDKKLEELRSQNNVAIVIVSSDAQDVARQKAEFQRIEQNLHIQFDYVELKNRKRNQLDRAALDVLHEKTKLLGDINQWRHDCSRYGTADTWERTKIAIKDKRKTGELAGRVKCFVLSPMPYEITDPTMDMQTKMLFQISTEEMKVLSKRILGAKRGQCLAGQHSGGDIPFPCDVVRSINGLETVRIHQIRITGSTMRKKQSGPKYEMTYPNGSTKLVYGGKDDPLPPLKQGEKQHYILTKDENRVKLIKEYHSYCLQQDIPVIWHRLGKEMNKKYPDTWGNGWTGNRVKMLMLNTAIMGKPSIGKTCHSDSPSLIIRSNHSPDGYIYNHDEISGQMNEESWVTPENKLFDLISEEDFEKLKRKVSVWDAIRESDLIDSNKNRVSKGLKAIKHKKIAKHWLRGLVWDVVDDYDMRISKNKLLCPIRHDHSKGKQALGCGVHMAMTPFERMIKEYIFLPDWNGLRNNEAAAKNLESSKKMYDLIDEYITEDEKRNHSFEERYELALERSNEDAKENINKLIKIVENLGYAIETCDNVEEIPSLRSRLTLREKEIAELKLKLSHSLMDDHKKDKENLVNLANSIHEFDNERFGELCAIHGIKFYVDKSLSNGWYVQIRSDKNPELPSLTVTYQKWRKEYVGASLATRPQVFQKGHKFHAKKIRQILNTQS
jgi:hypothetical protein